MHNNALGELFSESCEPNLADFEEFIAYRVVFPDSSAYSDFPTRQRTQGQPRLGWCLTTPALDSILITR